MDGVAQEFIQQILIEHLSWASPCAKFFKKFLKKYWQKFLKFDQDEKKSSELRSSTQPKLNKYERKPYSSIKIKFLKTSNNEILKASREKKHISPTEKQRQG